MDWLIIKLLYTPSILPFSIHGIGCKLVALLKYCNSDYKSRVSLLVFVTHFLFPIIISLYFLLRLDLQPSLQLKSFLVRPCPSASWWMKRFSSTFAKSIVSTCICLFRMPLRSSFSSSDTTVRSASPWISVLIPALCCLQKQNGCLKILSALSPIYVSLLIC